MFSSLFFVNGKHIADTNVFFICDEIHATVTLVEPILREILYHYYEDSKRGLWCCVRVIVAIKTIEVLKE